MMRHALNQAKRLLEIKSILDGPNGRRGLSLLPRHPLALMVLKHRAQIEHLSIQAEFTVVDEVFEQACFARLGGRCCPERTEGDDEDEENGWGEHECSDEKDSQVADNNILSKRRHSSSLLALPSPRPFSAPGSRLPLEPCLREYFWDGTRLIVTRPICTIDIKSYLYLSGNLVTFLV